MKAGPVALPPSSCAGFTKLPSTLLPRERRYRLIGNKNMQQSVVGLIGCGNISAAYLRAAPMFPHLRVKLVADADLSRAEARATEFGAKAASVDALLADPEIELVL